MTHPDRGGLTIRLVVRAYPASFRARFGDGLAEALRADRAAARAQGFAALAAFWAATLTDACWSGSLARVAALVHALRSQRESRESVMRSILFDLRDALRALRAAPIVSLMAVLSVALGVGANTALFSIMDGLVLKTLPVRDPGRLVLLKDGSWTNPIWEAIRSRQDQIFDGAFAWSNDRFDLSTSGPSDLVDGAYASGRMFDVLGIAVLRGRLFDETDDVRGGGQAGAVAVVSYGFWQSRFGGADSAIGQRLTISHVPFTIVGVTPPGFFGPEVGRSTEIFIPVGTEKLIRGPESMLDSRSSWWLEIMARTKPGQTIDGATAALRTAQPAIRADTTPSDWPATKTARYLAQPFSLVPAANGRSALRTRLAEPLTIILVVVGVVLVIACANIANLLLARATARRHELSVRLALGSSRARLARQLLVESLLLACTGGLIGLGLAEFGSRALVQQLTTSATTVVLDLGVDWRVFAFTAGVTLITATFFGLGPAFAATRVAPSNAMKEQGRGVTGDRRFGLRNVLVVVQVALSLVLVVAAGLFVRTFASLLNAPIGMNPGPVLMIRATLTNIPPAERWNTIQRLQQAAAVVPGVTSEAESFITPLSGAGWNTGLTVIGPGGGEFTQPPNLPFVNATTPGWFSTYGLRVIAGRDFTDADRAGAPPVVVVNETFVRQFLNGRNALGRQISGNFFGFVHPDPAVVVGVVSDAAYRSIRTGVTPTVYVPYAQLDRQPPNTTLAVTTANPEAAPFTRALSAALTNVDSRVGFTLLPLSEEIRGALSQERLVALLSAFFGGLALLLAVIGLYGVTTFAVNRRRAEIGVRMALGADARSVVRLVLGRVTWLVVAGVVLGGALAFWAAKFIGAALLFGLGPRDPLTFAAAAAMLVLAGFVAGWLPARRAAAIDPVEVLREG